MKYILNITLFLTTIIFLAPTTQALSAKPYCYDTKQNSAVVQTPKNITHPYLSSLKEQECNYDGIDQNPLRLLAFKLKYNQIALVLIDKNHQIIIATQHYDGTAPKEWFISRDPMGYFVDEKVVEETVLLFTGGNGQDLNILHRVAQKYKEEIYEASESMEVVDEKLEELLISEGYMEVVNRVRLKNNRPPVTKATKNHLLVESLGLYVFVKNDPLGKLDATGKLWHRNPTSWNICIRQCCGPAQLRVACIAICAAMY